jgi:hypothetical protein
MSWLGWGSGVNPQYEELVGTSRSIPPSGLHLPSMASFGTPFPQTTISPPSPSFSSLTKPRNTPLTLAAEKACSPLNLPYPQSEDIATALEITDMIRSKAVLPKPAMQSLKRRIASRNGRVQMYAFNVSSNATRSGSERCRAGRWCDSKP